MSIRQRIREMRHRRKVSNKASNGPLRSKIKDLVIRLIRCRDKLKEVQRGYYEQLRETLQDVYVIVLELQGNPEAWEWFIADAFWDEHEGQCPTTADQQDPWLFVTMYVHQAHSESKRKIASKHASALWLLAQENTKAGDVPEAIRTETIEKLAQRAAAKRSQLAVSNKSESTPKIKNPLPARRSMDAETDTKSLKTPTLVEGTFYLAPDLASDLHEGRGREVTITARVLPPANRLQLEIIRVATTLSKPTP